MITQSGYVGGRPLTIATAIRDDAAVRAGFFDLARRVFDLDFEPWYREGGWGDTYRPYVLLDSGRVVACVGLSRWDTLWQGRPCTLWQLGTVMTDPAWRGRGCARLLIERVQQDCRGCDLLFLYAHAAVRAWYPRFGFAPVPGYRAVLPLTGVRPVAAAVRKLHTDDPADRRRLYDALARGDRYSALPLTDPGLLWFYCRETMAHKLYWLEELHAVVIAGEEEGRWQCSAVLGAPPSVPLSAVLARVAPDGTCAAVLGFPPADPSGCVIEGCEEDLFVWQESRRLSWFTPPLLLPLLART